MFSLTTIFFFATEASIHHDIEDVLTKVYCDQVDSCWKTFELCNKDNSNTHTASNSAARFMACNDDYAVCAKGLYFLQPNKKSECYCKIIYKSMCSLDKAEAVVECDSKFKYTCEPSCKSDTQCLKKCQNAKSSCEKKAMDSPCEPPHLPGHRVTRPTMNEFVNKCTHMKADEQDQLQHLASVPQADVIMTNAFDSDSAPVVGKPAVPQIVSRLAPAMRRAGKSFSVQNPQYPTQDCTTNSDCPNRGNYCWSDNGWGGFRRAETTSYSVQNPIGSPINPQYGNFCAYDYADHGVGSLCSGQFGDWSDCNQGQNCNTGTCQWNSWGY